MPAGNRRRRAGLAFSALLVSVGAALVVPAHVHAIAKTWTGADGEPFTWSDPGNWADNIVPVSGDTITFPATASSRATVDDIAGLTIASMTFQDAFQLSGVDLAISGPITFEASSGQSVISDNLNLAAPSVSITNADSSSTDLFSGNIGETGGARALSVLGPGRVDLSGDETYTGGTTVDGGSAGYLLMDGPASTSDVSVEAGATLGGNGTAGNVAGAGGTVAPGSSPGHLTVASLSMTSASTFLVELNGTAAGSQYDHVTSNGGVSLGGSTLSISLGFTPAVGDAFTIIDKASAGAVTGTFAGKAEGGEFAVGGKPFRITYAGGDGNDVVLRALNAFTSTTAVSSSKNPSTAGDIVTFTATVTGTTGTPTGTVTFLDGSTTLGTATLDTGGVAALSTSVLAVGSHTISARYGGDSAFNGRVASLTQVVNAVATPPTGSPISPAGPALVLAGLLLMAAASLPGRGPRGRPVNRRPRRRGPPIGT